MRPLVAVAVCLLLLASTNAVPAGADGINSGTVFNDTYVVLGLPAYLTTSTPFTIQFTGPDPICSVAYAGATLTASPWAFTAVPASFTALPAPFGPTVSVTDCAGAQSNIAFDTIVPFTIVSNGYFDAETAAHSIEVTNQVTGQVGTITVTGADGAVLGSATVASGASGRVSFRTNQTTPVADYTLTATAPGGVQMVFTLTGTVGWTVMSDLDAFYTDCSTLTWIYLPSGQPRGTSQVLVLRDIRGALSRIAAHTGLRFRYSTDPSLRGKDNVITYHWANLGRHGPSGVGGPEPSSTSDSTGATTSTISGTVTLNALNWWASANATAGFGVSTFGFAGRGWLMVHESMHALGFDHTTQPRQIMDAVNSGQHAWGVGDLAGLRTLYPRSCQG